MIVTHTVRDVAELAYRDLWERELFEDELIGEEARKQFLYYPSVTRENFVRQGRITTLIENGQIFRDLNLGIEGFNPEEDRAMMCGSMAMIQDVAALMEKAGLEEGSNASPGDYVIERAFVG